MNNYYIKYEMSIMGNPLTVLGVSGFIIGCLVIGLCAIVAVVFFPEQTHAVIDLFSPLWCGNMFDK